jgi:hypothetical protein
MELKILWSESSVRVPCDHRHQSRKYCFFGSGFSAEGGFVTPRSSDVAEDEKGPSPFEPGPPFHGVANYFLTFALLARAADP